MQFHRARIIILSAILAIASIIATVAPALADGGMPPIPH